jgi:hypothetical protein
VLIVICLPLGSVPLFILAGVLSFWKGSHSLDLWPRTVPNTLKPPSKQCEDLVSGLKSTVAAIGSSYLDFLSLLGVRHKLCL